MSPEVEPVVDGRRARRERGRRAAIDAVVDLLHEGHVPMTASDIAERAGISAATLFRYFSTLDELQHEATDRFLDRHADLFDIPRVGVGPRRARVDRFTAARVALYEQIFPVARLSRARSFEHPHLATALHEVRVRLSHQIGEHFEAELTALAPAAAADVVALIATLTSFESWDQQRHDLERSSAQIRRAWRRGIESIID